MKWSTPVLSFFLLVPVLAGAQNTSVFPPKPNKKALALLDQTHVNARTRTLLRSKMKTHGGDMRELTVAVALLRYDAAQQHAQHIANQARVDRSAEGSTPDGIELSPAFFTMQDELKKNATELATIAEKKDQHALAAAMSKTLETCMGCHALFLPSAKAESKPEAAPAEKK
jgi:hypothetical protein